MNTDLKTTSNPPAPNLNQKDPKSQYYTPPPELDQNQMAERSFDLARLYEIAQVRESPLPQFDGMGYMKYNETNEKADISFIPPKKNKGDTRIVTGVTHEKDSTLLSFFLNLNFEGNVRVFYKDKENIEIGTALTKWVRKSREIEKYDQKRTVNYRNLIAQGTAFIREQYTEIWVPNKIITTPVESSTLDEVKWIERGLKLQAALCESVLVDGKKVFLENIREPMIQKEPGVYTVEYISRQLMESIWGQTKMWKYVPWLATPAGMDVGTLTQGSIYSDWVLGEVNYSKVEVVQVYRPFEQRYQIYVNGIPLLPPGFPLRAVSPKGIIPIAKGDIDLMNMFAYSKSEPAKIKVDQAVFDEILQTLVTKSRQGAFVPRANNTGKILTPDMFIGGRIITNIDPKQTPPLIENPGVTQSDFSFYKLFKEHIDDKSISSILEGNGPQGDVTLGQYMDMQKKQFLKLGSKLDGVIQWEKQLLELRVYNLLAHGAQKTEDGGYKDVSMEDSLFDGSKGLNVFKFTENNILSPYQVLNEEKKVTESNGINTEITYLNPKLMREMLDDPDYYFCFEVVPVDKNNDKITQVMFLSMITEAVNKFGMDSLNVANLKRRYAQVFNQNYDDLFLSEDELQMKAQQAQQEKLQLMTQNEGNRPQKNQLIEKIKESNPTGTNPLVEKIVQ